jgi:TRAP-type C4-dicarboxylate transport system substrate-binding protein
VLGEKKFQSLPEDLQKVVLEAGQEMQAYERELFLAAEQSLAQELQDLGMTFVEVDKAAFQEKATEAVLNALTPEQKDLYMRMQEVQ